MIGSGADALEHALELHVRPGVLASLRQRPLPDPVLLLIRIAAGGRHAPLQDAASRTSMGTGALTDVAMMYLRHILFGGLEQLPPAGRARRCREETFKEHYRWLMRWLHPNAVRITWARPTRNASTAHDILRSGERRAHRQERAQRGAWPCARRSLPRLWCIDTCLRPKSHHHRCFRRERCASSSARTGWISNAAGWRIAGGLALAMDEAGEMNVAMQQRSRHRPDTRIPARSPVVRAATVLPLQDVAIAPPHAPDAGTDRHAELLRVMKPVARRRSCRRKLQQAARKRMRQAACETSCRPCPTTRRSKGSAKARLYADSGSVRRCLCTGRSRRGDADVRARRSR